VNTFSNLVALLEPFERRQIGALQTAFPSPGKVSSIINGDVQFVVVQPPKSNESSINQQLPVIVAVGINYYQEPLAVGPAFRPYVNTHRPGRWVTDPSSGMHGSIDFALSAYRRNGATWASTICRAAGGRCYASAPASPLLNDYLLVIANLSAFLTLKQWRRHKKSDTAKLLSLWPPWPPVIGREHLVDMTTVIESSVDLWILHGPATVFPHANTLFRNLGWNPWLLTYNLSGLGKVNMIKAGKNPAHPLNSLYK
jgi:hypothetical protein